MNSLSFGAIGLSLLILIGSIVNRNRPTENERQIWELKAHNAVLKTALKTLKEIENGTL